MIMVVRPRLVYMVMYIHDYGCTAKPGIHGDVHS